MGARSNTPGVAKIWDSSVDGYCTNAVAVYYAIAGSSLALDVLIIILPIPVLIKLRLNTKQKFVIVGMFATGFFVTVIQIIRIFTIKNLKSYTNSGSIITWSKIEISLGIIVPCVPTFSPLIRSFSNSSGSGSLSNPPTTLEQSSRDTAVRNTRGTNKSYTTRGADITYGMGRMKSSNAFTTIGHHDRDDASSKEAIILQGAALRQYDEESLEDNLQIRTTTTVKI
ncbi:uncharacterized protein TRUGW13939_11046 [Talaromyces rugulosus]|uniref:Rhodopsin domain-containing protein n=1 Tax=Talaromyces rugulosus TaxID=121627 RepID=A0A7H8RBQ8_TALRU|nr:uncharacterized protein TRUGW13939_11046 [Talaromyces rugulosus]QKX63874.1 hypothetical protein TRUGW13939_11046 [Talaromyces rugulosus]